MSIRNAILAAAVLFAAAFSASSALAQQAQATVSLNVRSGPGTNYRVVDVLRDGEVVNIERCSGGWCRIEHNGPDGWASSRYLAQFDGRRDRGRDRDRGINPEIGFCVEAENFQFGINCDTDRDDRRRPGRFAEVCFYEHYNYRGASFCARPGSRDRSLSPRWNDRISSIRVSGRASAVVCQDFGFGGRCARVDNDIRRLGGRNNDTISSYRVERR